MNRIIKYNSIQSGVFDSRKNLIDIDIPNNNKQHNFKNSYVNLRGNISTTDTIPRPYGKAVYNYNFCWTSENGDASNYYMPNEAIIKNVRLTCDNYGVLEDTRRSDIIRTQLSKFTNSDDDIYGQNYRDLNQVKTQGDLKVDLGLDMKKEGSTFSSYKDVSVQIPLHKFLELGNMENFPTDKLGNTRLHMELNLDKIKLNQYQKINDEFGNPEYLLFNNVATLGDVEELTVTHKFSDLKHSPYFVGQLLMFSATKAGGTLIEVERLIINITYVNQTVTLTLDSPIATLVGVETLTLVGCIPVEFGGGAVEWNQCELVVEENADLVMMDELQYATFKNEEDNGNGLQNFSRQYNVEPECFNLFVCLPDQTDGDLWSINNNNALQRQYLNYRLRSDNVDLTDRDIVPDDPLYYDRVAMTLLNGNMPLKSLNRFILSINNGYDTRYGDSAGRLNMFIGNPLPMTPNNKLVQITIKCNTAAGVNEGVNSLQLYKQVFKSIKL